ncbi:MAG: hypothetical protein WAL98_04415 [Desulfatiglandaceae bacterium]|jgi:CO/xanthine dehydrogenase FAD-binding subunit
MKKFDYYQPQDLGETLNPMEKLGGNARYIAGGTGLIVRIRDLPITPERILSALKNQKK